MLVDSWMVGRLRYILQMVKLSLDWLAAVWHLMHAPRIWLVEENLVPNHHKHDTHFPHVIYTAACTSADSHFNGHFSDLTELTRKLWRLVDWHFLQYSQQCHSVEGIYHLHCHRNSLLKHIVTEKDILLNLVNQLLTTHLSSSSEDIPVRTVIFACGV